MTEQEWVITTDIRGMLESLKGKISDRKLRLFACSCCRAVWSSLTPQRIRYAVEVAEQYADGRTSEQSLHRARSQACDAANHFTWRRSTSRLVQRQGFTLEQGRLLFAAEAAHVHKPFLMGRGVQAPMLAILIGVVGGALSFGLSGVFLGPIILSVVWTLFAAWVTEPDAV